MRAAAELAGRPGCRSGGGSRTPPGHPVVRARVARARRARPTVLVYGHYDVQPPGDLAEWTTPPFELHRARRPRARGRGVADDKGPVFVARRPRTAFSRATGGCRSTSSSWSRARRRSAARTCPATCASTPTSCAADLVISADGAMWRPSEPSLSTAVQGPGQPCTSRSPAPPTDLHSGRYGGTVANPAHALVQVLAATARPPDGAVAVPGFYDGIPPLTTARRAEIAAVGFDDHAYAAELGVAEVLGEPGYSTLERLWERPTLEINGIQAGGKYTVIPHRARPATSRAAWSRARTPTGAAGRRRPPRGRPPPASGSRSSRTRPASPRTRSRPTTPRSARRPRPWSHVYPGQQVLLACIGGTLPATALFEEVLGAKTLFFSFSTADERLHAPNEFLRTRRLAEGMRAWEQLWLLLADGPHRLATPPDGAAMAHDEKLRLLLLPHPRGGLPRVRPRPRARPRAGL